MRAVAALRVGRKALAKRHSDSTGALLAMAASIADRPSPDEIHDLRVAARRIQVMRRLMPRGVRGSRRSKRFDLTLRALLKATSQLRDMDTFMDTLESHESSLPPGLLVILENQRSDAAARAKMVIGALAEVPAPKVGASELTGRRLTKKLRKRLRRHSKQAASLLTDVLTDESKAAELHLLRKEVKKIRYLAEITAKPPAGLLSLAKWQESLGAIHDIDVAVAHLNEVGAGSGRAIVELQRARHLEYLKFVRDCRRALGEDGELPAGAPAPTGLNQAEA